MAPNCKRQIALTEQQNGVANVLSLSLNIAISFYGKYNSL